MFLFLFWDLQGSLAVDPNSSSWEGHYEANDWPSVESGIPLDSDPGFPTGFSSVSGGLLNLNTLGSDTLVVWGQTANSLLPAMDFSTGATFEIRARTNAIDGDGGMAIEFSDSGGNNIRGEWSPGGGGWFRNGLNPGLAVPFLVPDPATFHTLRFVINSLGVNGMSIYLDDNLVPTYTGTVVDSTSASRIWFGDPTSTFDADWDIDYIRWTDQGAFAPSGSNTSTAVYITEMNLSQPASALSTTIEQGKWMLMPYETVGGLSGTMAFAPPFISPPPITIPLNATGWHAVYVAFWNPLFNYDEGYLNYTIGSRTRDYGGSVPMVKLTGEGFRPLGDEGHTDSGLTSSSDVTFLREVFFKYADLTGRDLVVAKPNGPKGRKLFLAYVKLVPLSPAEITEIQNDRADTSNRRLLGATIDGSSYFHLLGVNEPNDVLQEVELYRDSDTAGVIWAVASGDTLDYPTQIPGARWRGDSNRASLIQRTGANDSSRGIKHSYDAHRVISDAGLNSPVAIAASHVKEMEAEIGYRIKFEAMFRLGITGRIPGDIVWDPNSFVNQNPQYNQVLQTGKVIHKASYAYAEVRQFMLDLIEETATNFDITGVSLCFLRGLHLIASEQPVADYLLTTYGKNINSVSSTDPDLYASRTHFMTQFVSDVRGVLDTVGTQKGEVFDLSVWVWPQNENYWLGGTPMSEGLDVIDWIQTGLVDNVMCVDRSGATIDIGYKNACDLNNVNYVYATDGSQAMSPSHATFAYNAGVNYLATWDIDLGQYLPWIWQWVKRIGHKDEMANDTWFDPGTPFVQLTSINGIDISQSMVDAMYTGMWGP
jgi:hypothetical protein